MKPLPCMKYLISAFLSVAHFALWACGGWYDEGSEYYDFLDYSLYEEAIKVLEVDGRYHHGNGGLYIPDESNLEAWKAYIGLDVSIEELRNLVYKVPLDDLLAIKEGNKPHSDVWQAPTVLALWNRGKKTEALDYLIYAKRCQVSADRESSWFYEIEIDQEDVASLIDEGMVLFGQSKSKEIRLRTAYQLVRMAHYTGKLKLAEELFEKYLGKHKKRHVIYYYTLEQLGGVFNRQDRSAEAAYLYSKVFSQCASRRDIALRSYKFTTDWPNEGVYTQALKLCKNEGERADLYLIQCAARGGFSKNLLLSIYAIDPNHEMLLGLMYVDLVELQKQYLRKEEYLESDLSPENTSYRLHFVNQVLEEGKRDDLEHFRFIKAYLYFLQGDWEQSKAVLATVENAVDLGRSVKSLNMLLELVQLEQVTEKEESHFLDVFQEVSETPLSQDIRSFWLSQFRKKYMEDGRMAKAFLCFNTTEDFINRFTPGLMNDILEYINKEELTLFDHFLIGDYQQQKTFLYECFGTYYFRKGQLDSANIFYDSVDVQSGRGESQCWFQPSAGYPKDIFYSRADDWQDGIDGLYMIDEKALSSSHLIKDCKNRQELVKQIQFLQKQAEQGSREERALCYYLLGNVWYNIGGHGLYRRVLNYAAGHRAQYDHDSDGDYYFSAPGFDMERRYFNDNSASFDYFGLAEKYSIDYELKAKAAFGQAKCQGNQMFFDAEDNITFNYAAAFEKLHKKYRRTAYYSEVLAECGYFKSFVKHQ